MIPAIYPLIGLGLMAVALAAIALAPYCREFRRVWFALAAVAAILYAGTKPSLNVNFALGLKRGNVDYDATEHVLTVEWSYTVAVADSVFRWKYQINDGEWIDLPDGMVRDGRAVAAIVIEDGDRLNVQCYAVYVAPVQVVTNGVYHLNGVMRSINSVTSSNPDYVTPGVPIIVADLTLTPTNKPNIPDNLKRNMP